MTPKEKYEDLYKRIDFQLFNGNGDPYDYKSILNLMVDELIKYLPSSAGNPPNLQENESNREFWIKVKYEINNDEDSI